MVGSWVAWGFEKGRNAGAESESEFDGASSVGARRPTFLLLAFVDGKRGRRAKARLRDKGAESEEEDEVSEDGDATLAGGGLERTFSRS